MGKMCDCQYLSILLLYIRQYKNISSNMNLSPSRLSTQPLLSPNCIAKPKIAFTYQFNNPTLAQPIQIPSQSKPQNQPLLKPALLTPTQPHPPVSVPHDTTPRKIHDKQNIPKHLPQDNISIASMKKRQNNCYRSNFTNFQPNINTVPNGNCSPTNAKLPPLSPKANIKKNHNRCPSFLSQKNASNLEESVGCFGQGDISMDKVSINIVCPCGKPITHKYGKNQGCCSKCGINKMLQGHQLQPIPSPVSSPSSQPQKPQSPCIPFTPQTFLQSLISQKQSLTQHYTQLTQTKEQQNILQYYKDKKQQLKIHYQKIKTAIKESIDQDLKYLENVQKQQIQNWKKCVSGVEDSIKKLENLENQVKNGLNKEINEAIVEKFNQIVKSKVGNKLSKIVPNQQTLNISTVSNTQSLILNPLAAQKYSNGQLYKSQIYRMMGIIRTQRSARSSSILSCSNMNTHSQIHSPQQCSSPRQDIKNSPVANEPKNVLFSFQANK